MKKLAPVALLSMLTSLFACNATETNSPSSTSDFEVRAAKAPAAGYTATEIGTLPGDVESYAWAVNNAGHVAVMSTYFSSTEPRRARWFIRAAAGNTMFDAGPIKGLSNGSTTYVAGYAASGEAVVPTIWTFSLASGFSLHGALDYSPGYGGSIEAVSDAAQATGGISFAGASPAGGTSAGAIWNTDGTRIDIPNPDPATFEGVVGRAINNSGDVAIQMHDNSGLHRGYLRTSDGTMIMLPPLVGHVSSLARGVSERIGHFLYVAGTSDDRNGNYRAVRWTVDVSSPGIVATQVRPERSYSIAMADDGTIAGDLSGAGTTAFVWETNNTLVTLKPPKGSNSGTASSISGDGRFVAGAAKYGSYNKAVHWAATP